MSFFELWCISGTDVDLNIRVGIHRCSDMIGYFRVENLSSERSILLIERQDEGRSHTGTIKR
ncbi:hypothetical protein JCM16163A_45340 [Paenibacillus sp. YK5]|uniref:Uncharacterized protein n=1 Tax=Paenibacillus naphthalenovorans TaxID=162209 RepID=A0A0U2UKD9_9BACL|nr:hypothetical protein IJ22_20270 [Paenibacillus naphthalenovorans]GCL70190.1 hypothetical protein PN4B1_00900 [Paenibacillus naphthalenovorans]SDH89383.1 hypothetical protein SAMN05421868_101474 [Paenibacillus naphthalenovorans]